MKMLRNLSWTCVPGLFAVVAILSGVLPSFAAMAQEAKAVENFPTVLQRNITLWSDGTRLSGVLLYPRGRIGIWGTSFGGGHVIYRAAHDSRIACVVAQVGSMPDDWTKRFPAGLNDS